MSQSFNLQFSVAPFPVGFQGDLNAFAQQLAANLSATITGNFLQGQIGGNQPTQNVGPWQNGFQWWFWNASLNAPAYQPEFSLNYLTYNALINGDTQVWQRQASVASIGAGTGVYVADRWGNIPSGTFTGLATVSRVGPTGIAYGQFPNTANTNTEYCQRVTVTTPQASLAAGDYFFINQWVELQNAYPNIFGTTSVGIALRSSIAGTYCVSLTDAVNAFSWVAECNIVTSATWQFFPFANIPTFPAGANFGSGDNMLAYGFRICLAAGTTFRQGTHNTWNSGNNMSTVNQANLFATNGATFDFTLAQHQPGSIVTPFKFKNFPTSLLECKRYYQKTYGYNFYPPSIIDVNNGIWPTLSSSSAILGLNYVWPVNLRAIPALGTNLIFYSPATGVANKIRDIGAGVDRTVSSANLGSNIVANATCSAPFTAGNFASAEFIVDVDF